MRSPALSIATCGYVGYVRIAPGTAGSIVGLALYGAAGLLGGMPVQGGLCAAVLVVGVWSASASERQFGETDPGAVVIDEVAGMLVTLLGLQVSWSGALAGFLAFRFFDVVKPFPARWAEGLPGGWGIMADDVIAGVYAHLTLRLLLWGTGPAAVF